MLIAIFVLLLVSVVAIALIVSSGTETALGANYRASSTVYYSALAGLEEARGRLLPKNPNYLGLTIPISTPMALGQTIYLYNGLTGETVAPWDSSNPYYDTEYVTEFSPTQASAASWQSVASLWNNNAQSMPGPLYKWVRINAVTEKSLYIDVNQDGTYDSTTPIYYDPAHVDSSGNPLPSMISTASPPATASQVLEITALAQMPKGSKKVLQYLVAPSKLNLTFPAALVLEGTSPKFTAPTSAAFYVKGTDQGPVGSCAPGAAVNAIGYTDSGASLASFEQPSTLQGIQVSGPDLRGNYTSTVPPAAPNPNIGLVSLPTSLSTVGGLNALVQTIEMNADVVINRDATQADMPAAMSAANPMTIVVNGDLVFSGWHGTGYGLLLVTGNMTNLATPSFTYDPDAFWNGIILVIGKGWIYSYQGSYTNTQIQGAVLVAKTIDDSGVPLAASSAPASPYFNFTSTTAANGIYYSSCWVKAAEAPLKYQVLSFHEIPQ